MITGFDRPDFTERIYTQEEAYAEEHEFLLSIQGGQRGVEITDYDKYVTACKRHNMKPIPEVDEECDHDHVTDDICDDCGAEMEPDTPYDCEPDFNATTARETQLNDYKEKYEGTFTPCV